MVGPKRTEIHSCEQAQGGEAEINQGYHVNFRHEMFNRGEVEGVIHTDMKDIYFDDGLRLPPGVQQANHYAELEHLLAREPVGIRLGIGVSLLQYLALELPRKQQFYYWWHSKTFAGEPTASEDVANLLIKFPHVGEHP